MQGQKQITTFIVILIVIITFTFFRNTIRKEKEFKRIREEALRKKLETSLQDIEEGQYIEMDEIVSIDTKNYMYKFLEYKDKCYDLHAIIFKPDKLKTQNQQSHIILNEDNAKADESQKNDHQHETAGQLLESKHQSSVITGPFIYLVIILLIYSFIKAATDMSRQLSKRNSGDESGKRKCSLQEYAGTSKRNRRSSRAPVLKRATTVSVEPRLSIKQQSLEERRKSYILPELHNGTPLFVEPGIPPKAINGIGTRPPPLLRRCSVPAFALQSGHSSVLRRPSVDSHSEDDSSPDVKRRVRMIHRH